MRDYPTRIDGDYSPEAVANFFLDLAKKDGMSLTNIKLQKLIYFANGFYLARTGSALVNRAFSAWSYGPVLPELYDRLSVYRKEPVTNALRAPDAIGIDSKAAMIIRDVWGQMKRLSAWRLIELSHKKDSPWDRVWDKGCGYLKMIPKAEIRPYFQKLLDDAIAKQKGQGKKSKPKRS